MGINAHASTGRLKPFKTAAGKLILFIGTGGLSEVFEAGGVFDEGQLERSGGTVALLGDDDLGDSFEFGRNLVLAVVVFFAEDEGDDVGVLLDGAGFAQIGELRTLLAFAATFRSTAELGERDYGAAQLFGESL